MDKLISPAQLAFIPGRSITDNILLTHDLVRGFHLNRGPPTMCLKLDLSKAFDSIKWDFIEAALKCFNFPIAAVK